MLHPVPFYHVDSQRFAIASGSSARHDTQHEIAGLFGMGDKTHELRSYCRRCGGERNHLALGEKVINWTDDYVDGGDAWYIVQCRGCDTVTFRHESWFSEDIEMTEEGPVPKVKVDLYPPAPLRKMPEWNHHFVLDFTQSDRWIFNLHEDIYRALGLRAYSLAAMGLRAIADHIVTSRAGDRGSFKDKLERMRDGGLFTAKQLEVIFAAFDAGSASAHRGYEPSEEDALTQLDIVESLMEQFYIIPMRHAKQERAAAALRANTPARTPSKLPPK